MVQQPGMTKISVTDRKIVVTYLYSFLVFPCMQHLSHLTLAIDLNNFTNPELP